MDDNTLTLMLFGSLLLGGIGVTAFIWGLKSGQFDDEKKMTHGLLFDGEEEYIEAINREERLKTAAETDKKATEQNTNEEKQ
jgi:cbb3-type cytochrome oxidase maturation protein